MLMLLTELKIVNTIIKAYYNYTDNNIYNNYSDCIKIKKIWIIIANGSVENNHKNVVKQKQSSNYASYYHSYIVEKDKLYNYICNVSSFL